MGWKLVSVLLLAACETGSISSAHAIRGPDGKWAYAVSCAESQVYCWKEAGKACPQGYSILDRASSTWVTSRMYMSRSAVAISQDREYQGGLLIRCEGCWGPDCDKK